MPIAPEATYQHTQVVQPEGALIRESRVSFNTSVSVNTIVAGSPQNPKLLDRVRALIRTKHYSIKTERIYVFWIRHFVRFHGKRHPLDLGKAEVEAFLSHLANAKHVAASTQNQALAALLFLYKEVLETKLPWLDGVVRAKRPKHLPVVLTKTEVDDLLARVDGTVGLFVRLLYGTGLRIMECATLRVMDINFDAGEVIVRNGKGAKDRVTMLPQSLVEPLKLHLKEVRAAHDVELAARHGDVELPFALARKYPRAAFAFATHLLEAGYDIRTVQELLGHSDVSTTPSSRSSG